MMQQSPGAQYPQQAQSQLVVLLQIQDFFLAASTCHLLPPTQEPTTTTTATILTPGELLL